jgi:hypothetical protein
MRIATIIAAFLIAIGSCELAAVAANETNDGSPDVVIPPSKMINLDSPNRVPRSYLVRFHNISDLAASNADGLEIARETLPTNSESAGLIANAFAAKYRILRGRGNVLSGLWCFRNWCGFGIGDIDEVDIAELAQDPRVWWVEPDVYGKSTRQTAEPDGPVGSTAK